MLAQYWSMEKSISWGYLEVAKDHLVPNNGFALLWRTSKTCDIRNYCFFHSRYSLCWSTTLNYLLVSWIAMLQVLPWSRLQIRIQACGYTYFLVFRKSKKAIHSSYNAKWNWEVHFSRRPCFTYLTVPSRGTQFRLEEESCNMTASHQYRRGLP